jgi:NTE family protein
VAGKERQETQEAGARRAKPARKRKAQIDPCGPVEDLPKGPEPGRPPHEAYAVRALVLQGGGALGAYQAGVYQGLTEGGIYPNWVAGISIGALNAAIIAGNPPERRVEQLRAFWEYICAQPWLPSLAHATTFENAESWPEPLRVWFDGLHAARAMFEGQRGFFMPRNWLELVTRYTDPTRASYYDTTPLKATLERFADFDLINRPKEMRVSVGAVNVRTGNFAYFDNTRDTLLPEHFMASGALPPGFPAVEIEGEYYWDGGLVSNTPLAEVLTAQPRRDALIFQVDLWSARGKLPHDLSEVAERQKDIQYSSRTRFGTDMIAKLQKLRNALGLLLKEIPAKHVPPELLADLEPWLCDRVFNIIHLIYRAKPYEEQFKDYAFGRSAMQEHWAGGLEDMTRSLGEPAFFVPPAREIGVVTHDIHRGENAA